MQFCAHAVFEHLFLHSSNVSIVGDFSYPISNSTYVIFGENNWCNQIRPDGLWSYGLLLLTDLPFIMCANRKRSNAGFFVPTLFCYSDIVHPFSFWADFFIILFYPVLFIVLIKYQNIRYKKLNILKSISR